MDTQITNLLNQVALDLIGIAVILILRWGAKFAQKAMEFVDSKTNLSDRAFLSSVAKDAVLLIEQQWKDLEGSAKFSQAVQHAVQVLTHHGIILSTQDIQAAIQSAYNMAKNENLIK